MVARTSDLTLRDADGNVPNSARKSEDDDNDEEQEEEQNYYFRARWWFAATGFPLIAGTFGPMASAFSILALVENWREDLGGNDEHTGQGISDPKWQVIREGVVGVVHRPNEHRDRLIGINAAQLAVALVANLFLLLNMARTVRFSIAQPITVGGWWISSFVLIGLCATASGPMKLPDPANQQYSQAFYYAIISASLYFLVASLMTVTVVGALAGKYEKNFQLTMSQRTLMLQTISLLAYLEISAVIYSYVEGWSFLDSVYFSNVTLLTIRLGDITPTTHLGRSLFFPFAVGGIIIIGLVIGSIRNLILDTGGEKIGARIIEKERERELKRFLKNGGDHSAELDRHRRRDEFELMRKILHDASRRKRWTALCISGSVWFILWFAGAAVFQAAEKDQGWSYFESVYFAYVCLLTIGYGDFYPTSNSGKPFFVVWSLLAIPSLTILISNMSDTIVKAVNDATIWVGNVTILPGEGGIKLAITYPVAKITRGKVFGDSFRATAPGLLGESRRPRMNRDQSSRNNFKKDDPESTAGQHNDQRGKREAQKAKDAEASGYRYFPKAKKDLYVVLIDEIASVTKDLSSNPPREYSFEEWMWYLRLIGEDSDYPQGYIVLSSASTTKEKEKGKNGEGEGGEIEGGRQWNWVDTNSPLMGSQEEPQWVLKRLTRRLQRELRALNTALDGDTKGEREDNRDIGEMIQ